MKYHGMQVKVGQLVSLLPFGINPLGVKSVYTVINREIGKNMLEGETPPRELIHIEGAVAKEPLSDWRIVNGRLEYYSLIAVRNDNVAIVIEEDVPA